jgi:hypothetical protein
MDLKELFGHSGKEKYLLFVLEVAARLLNGQARDLTTVTYTRIF